ncbi:unnamed protein product [Didymodactylos carnosus]|uniref:B box-type domain-containing protein n=1 Tax=Didymodactylos carnosus TaxID=1234261 RepID=A0A814GHG5_9BILA|nr:unnamed protein product [Didymodactylos carnosus]CAF0996534.1 unnamed protein product [Didymodactylos carnosus]CAF3534502.1 unnamed protein product [Didymodactylos carnosus]CAF3768133.1 unnamed protein product [Didymodactylos carnosus]
MTSSAKVKQPSTSKKCDICQKHAGILLCTGCDQTFCRKDFNEHRQQLSTQLDIIIREHDLLKQNTEQICDATTSKVFDEIEKWEMEWMKKVKMAADRAREEVRDIVAEPKKQLKRITDEIRSRMAEEDFVEYDLDRWMNEIKQLTVDVKAMPTTIVVESGDECEWKRIIKVRKMEHQSHVSNSPQRSEKGVNKVKQLDFNKLKDQPHRQIKVDGSDYAIGASDMNVLYCGEGTLCLTDRTGRKTNTLQSGGLNVCSICWSLFLDRFLILTKRTLHSLNVQTSEVTQIKQVSDKNRADFYRCTCSNQTLLLSFDQTGSVVEEWDMSGKWKMMRSWQPPVSCQQNEWICEIRFSFDSSQLGVTVWVVGRYNQFHVRDRSMNILNNITFPRSTYGYLLLSLPNGQWLTNEHKNKELHIIDRDGKLEQTLIYNKSVLETTLLGQRCLVIRTDDKQLSFHDL